VLLFGARPQRCGRADASGRTAHRSRQGLPARGRRRPHPEGLRLQLQDARGQTRKSGDPYIVHPVSVAGIIAELRLDTASVCAGLLHDVVEDTLATTEDIEKEFGVEIADLVDGVTKLSKINFTSKEDRQAENFRKMVVAMARDIRVLLVKLCDRLDNMRTLEHMTPEKRRSASRARRSRSTRRSPTASASRLQERARGPLFKYLEPDAYADLVARSEDQARARQVHRRRLQDALEPPGRAGVRRRGHRARQAPLQRSTAR
jgi:guanosine-3',5'-bis(diphosphate) 3'-pyrophosphohydrolase